MKHVQKSVLLWYSPREMYALVTAVEDYPKFLPWCSQAEVMQRHDDGVTARLHIAFAGVRQAFTTRNTHDDNRCLTMKLVEGPFSSLEGTWRFTPLQTPATLAGGAGAEAPAEPTACKVEFSLDYAFSSRSLEIVISPVFDRIANTFVEAFVKRAEQVYGPR
jgi:ribosome-associated toxin RatA of RatAB toxin-antitoxin module